jgi:soluble lytic murein transglycosylase
MLWLDRFLQRYPGDPRRTEALLQRGQAIARGQGRESAAAWLEARAKAEKKPSARAALLYAAATHRWNTNQDTAALALFERVVSFGTGIAEEQRAHYSIGRIHEAAGRFDRAAASYKRSRSGSDATVASESRWREGWVAYLGGDFVRASVTFGEAERASRGERPRDAHDALLYWQARSLERAGNEGAADEAYRALITESPDSFYAYLAEKRTGLAARLPQPAPVSAPTNAGDADVLTRIGILNRAGFADLGSVEVRRLLDGKSPAQKVALLPGLAGANAHAAALKTALDLYARRELSEDQLYAFLYPAAFESIVQRESAAKALDPYLVYSLMKQESLFDPHAVSSASAVGLMQLLPSTARRLAGVTDERALGADDLVDPNLNVRLGVTYLAELAARYHNDPVFILASYNAGEKAADSWKERFGALELDELVERVTYRETRQYVKKVLGNYRNYLRLYAGLRPIAPAQQSQ